MFGIFRDHLPICGIQARGDFWGILFQGFMIGQISAEIHIPHPQRHPPHHGQR
ncbi:MAG: hypothetical protein ACK55Z_16985 [bacterium]